MLDNKCVIVVNENLPIGQIANAVAVLSLSIGRKHPDIVGYDLIDSNNQVHQGITMIPVPVLKAAGKITKIRESLAQSQEMLTVIDLISATSTTRSYEEYALALKNTPAQDLQYYGVAVYGPKKLVNQYTGSLGLLR